MGLFSRRIVLPDPTMKIEVLEGLIQEAYLLGMNAGIQARRHFEDTGEGYTTEEIRARAKTFALNYINDTLELKPFRYDY